MKEIYIWQLPIANKKCFKPVDYNIVDIREYVLVYQLEEDFSIKKITNFLEELYGRLNINEPQDFHARSMSTSDLIMIRDRENNKIIANYVVDLVGFKKVEVEGILCWV